MGSATGLFPRINFRFIEKALSEGRGLGEGNLKQKNAMNLNNKARALRKNQTDVELLLWQQLRNRRLCSYKFRRQFPIAPYVADFACLELKLIIELDGGQHADQISYDNQRSLFLEQRGFKVIRFWNNDVIQNTTGILEAIHLVILDITERSR
jgi:very-short-patch-repair endonuclease